MQTRSGIMIVLSASAETEVRTPVVQTVAVDVIHKDSFRSAQDISMHQDEAMLLVRDGVKGSPLLLCAPFHPLQNRKVVVVNYGDHSLRELNGSAHRDDAPLERTDSGGDPPLSVELSAWAARVTADGETTPAVGRPAPTTDTSLVRYGDCSHARKHMRRGIGKSQVQCSAIGAIPMASDVRLV